MSTYKIRLGQSVLLKIKVRAFSEQILSCADDHFCVIIISPRPVGTGYYFP